MLGAGVYELKDALHGGVGATALIVGTVVRFVVAYASVAWLIRFVAKHTIEILALYRVALGIVLLILLATETISAT